MPKIDVDDASIDFLRSSIVYGVSRAGKTVLDATFPRPAIIASEREGGVMSVKTMDRALWYEPSVKPLIYTVSEIKETAAYIKEIAALAKKGQVKTLVLELSFYSDDIIRALTAPEEKNGWAKYKTLDDHINWLDTLSKTLGIRIAYNALAADPGDLASKSPGGLQLAGKAIARKLPASTDLTGYLTTEDRGNGVVDRLLHLVPYGMFPAGHRYGGRLPSIVRNPTYRKLEDLFAGRAAVEYDGSVVYGEAAERARARAAQQKSQATTSSIAAPSTVDDLPPL